MLKKPGVKSKQRRKKKYTAAINNSTFTGMAGKRNMEETVGDKVTATDHAEKHVN